MKTPIKGFLVGAGLALAAFLVIAAVPALTDFASTQFGVGANKVSIKSGVILTNAADTGTFTADAVVVTNILVAGAMRTDLVTSTTLVSTATMRAGMGQITNQFILLATTASTLPVIDANKSLASLANAAGVLTNNGAGGFSYVAISGGSGDVTNTYNTTITTNNFFVNGKGNTLIITNSLALSFVPNAVLVTDGAALVTNAVLSGLTYTPATRALTVDPAVTWPMAADWIFAGTYPRSDSATLITVGDMSPTSTATIAAVANTESRAGHLTATTSTVLGNVSGWESGVTSWVPGLRRTIFDCTVMLTDSVSNRVWVGLSAANMATLQGLDTPTSAMAAFRFSFDAGDTQLMTVTMQDSATTPDVTTTGLTIVTNTLLRLRIDATPTSAGVGTVRYYTNGVLAYTSSVIPTNTILHRIQWGVSTRVSGASRQLRWWGTSIKSAYP